MSEEFIIELLKILFPAGVGAISTGTALWILILLFPEKIEKWQGVVWGLVESLGILYNRASKQKIRYNIQSRVTSFAKKLDYNLPEFDPPTVKIHWVDEKTNKQAFIEGGNAVIRLRREDPNNVNIATACMLYVSSILLRKAGRYLSPTQRESIELYVGYKMLQDQDEGVLDVFVDRWLYPGIEESNQKVADYFDRYGIIDEAEFFMPIFLQELIYLGEKVFGRKRDGALVKEVDGALQFLEIHESRRLGEKLDRPYFNGNACKFGIMIVGIQPNIEDERHDVYLRHIKEVLLPCDIETIYLIGPKRNSKFMKEIADFVSDEFNIPFKRDYSATFLTRKGEKIPSSNHLLVLRRKIRKRYIR